MKKQPEEMTVINLQCLLMPNGEIIHQGKTVGFFDKCKKYIEEIREV